MSKPKRLSYMTAFWDFHMRYLDAMKRAGYYMRGGR